MIPRLFHQHFAWPALCRHTCRIAMDRKRRHQAGFTLTEMMIVVVILGLLAAVSMPMFGRDNAARKGRDYVRQVAQVIQRARFQAMSDRRNMHVQFYRARVDVYAEDPPGTYALLSSLPSPVDATAETVAIWDLLPAASAAPSAQSTNLTGAVANPSPPGDANDLIFTPLGGTQDNGSYTVYIRNELLPAGHPDAGFSVTITGLTGYVSTQSQVPLP
jgi:prepilin-type N-terminal cleavage/methylation domain-containing protein